MDHLSCLRTFIEVAQNKSFTEAARHLGLSRASATKHVAALEDHYQARLLTRNSQFVSLTEAGKLVLEGGLSLLSEIEHIADRVQATTTELSGKITMGVPPAFGAHYLTPAIAAFQRQATGVEFDLQIDDGTSNLVREGQDVCIRITESLESTDEIARLIAYAPQVMVAAPAYLDAFPPLRTPKDLKDHQCLLNTLKTPNGVWSFARGEERISVPVTGPLRSNFGNPLLAAALYGQGLTIHPVYMIRDYIDDGRLQVALPDYRPTQLRIHAVYPQRKFLPTRIRSFLDFLKAWVEDHHVALDV